MLFTMFVLFMFHSCVPETPQPPFGVWKSNEPNIVLYLKPDYFMTQIMAHLGTYSENGYELKVFVHFGHGLRFRMTEANSLRADGGMSLGEFLTGTYQLVGDQIHYRPTPVFRERLGLDMIVFYRVDDYDPINPEDWFAHLEAPQSWRSEHEIEEQD